MILLGFLPLMIIIAIVICIDDPSAGPFFKQKRVGRHGKEFNMYKFRSMADLRDENGEMLPDEQRLGKFGKLLRSTSLDELPSLWNVVRLETALVGPRSLYLRYNCLYNEKQARRLEVRPGITGLAQVNGRNAISWEKRFEYDIEYVDNITFIGDWKIMFKTVRKVFKREGITSATSVTMEEFKGSEAEVVVNE